MKFFSVTFFGEPGFIPEIRVTETKGGGVWDYCISIRTSECEPFSKIEMFCTRNQLLCMADSLHEQVVTLQNEADIEAAEEGGSDG